MKYLLKAALLAPPLLPGERKYCPQIPDPDNNGVIVWASAQKPEGDHVIYREHKINGVFRVKRLI